MRARTNSPSISSRRVVRMGVLRARRAGACCSAVHRWGGVGLG